MHHNYLGGSAVNVIVCSAELAYYSRLNCCGASGCYIDDMQRPRVTEARFIVAA